MIFVYESHRQVPIPARWRWVEDAEPSALNTQITDHTRFIGLVGIKYAVPGISSEHPAQEYHVGNRENPDVAPLFASSQFFYAMIGNQKFHLMNSNTIQFFQPLFLRHPLIDKKGIDVFKIRKTYQL